MAISDAEIEQAKRSLPRGWGRFGKALEHLKELSAPDEALLAACIGTNPSFKMTVAAPTSALGVGMLASNYLKDTNLLLAATNQRILAVATGLSGSPRSHTEIPYAGLEIVRQEKKELELCWSAGSLTLKGMHKDVVPVFADALRTQLQAQPRQGSAGA